MRHLDLFSGIGGFALACQWNGIETIGFVEIDKYCQKVLKKHWPKVPIVEDIRDVEKIKEIVANATKFSDSELSNNGNCQSYQEPKRESRREGLRTGILPRETRTLESPAILVTAGFPCQPFSVAGKRQGERDDRYLWPETFAAIEAVNPKWVLLENVTGIINLALDQVLSDMEGAGYSYETLIIPACAVNAWHRRDRVWIVCHTTSDGLNDSKTGKRIKPRNKRGTEGENKVCQSERASGLWTADANTQREGLEGADAKGSSCPTEQPLQSGINPKGNRIQSGRPIIDSPISRDWWAVEPELGRVAHGIPNRVDRLKCLGNAIVPQIAFEIIKAIKEVDGR